MLSLKQRYEQIVNGGTKYIYYAHNWRGDVIALYNSAGTLFARYEYDAWGKLLSIKNANGVDITNTGNFAIVNPFRYRGYYYDTESGLYYLQSRYYDPTTGRFVNADVIAYSTNDSFVGMNLYAYANNNFINNVDSKGYFAFSIAALVTVAIATVATVATTGVVISVVNDPGFQRDFNRALNWAGSGISSLFNYLKNGISRIISRPKSISRVSLNRKTCYWAADLINKKVVVSTPLSFTQACTRVSCGKNIMCQNEEAAKAIIVINRYRNAVGPERGCGNDYYWHYHPTRNHTGSKSVHIWFYR